MSSLLPGRSSHMIVSAVLTPALVCDVPYRMGLLAARYFAHEALAAEQRIGTAHPDGLPAGGVPAVRVGHERLQLDVGEHPAPHHALGVGTVEVLGGQVGGVEPDRRPGVV